MTAFEYLSVLISIILGLGIAQLLAGVGRWIECRRSLQPFLPTVLWIGVLLLIHVQTWWTMFGLRGLTEWTFVKFAIVLLQPILLYLLATVASPAISDAGGSMRDSYFDRRPWFFGLLASLLAVSLGKDLLVSGALPGPMNLAFHGLFLAVAISGLVSRRLAVHHIGAVIVSIAIASYIALLFAELR